MSPYVAPHLFESARPGRIAAIMEFGFTLRQARCLVHVLVYWGVFLERQYRTFAGLHAVYEWTVRLLVPRRLRKATALYRYGVRDTFVTPPTPQEVGGKASRGMNDPGMAREGWPRA